MSKELRKELTQYVRQHSYIFKDPSGIPPRPNRSTQYPELQVHEGYACRKCEFFTNGLKQMASYLGRIHLREQPSKKKTDDLYDDVFLSWPDA